uniref:(California timema) hypothetical protein n=1 Tax=Timema californicum TaxID=61474 RepID=A0A7R9PAW6_TIMCA|nr:unnamed protein product [Timema californicum]
MDLNKHFEAPPYSQAVEVGGSVELRCHPPIGVPPPTVYWLKNNAPLETDTNLIVSSEGHLLVGQARLEDTANYTCVAENVAAHRLSEAARLIVYDSKPACMCKVSENLDTFKPYYDYKELKEPLLNGLQRV